MSTLLFSQASPYVSVNAEVHAALGQSSMLFNATLAVGAESVSASALSDDAWTFPGVAPGGLNATNVHLDLTYSKDAHAFSAGDVNGVLALGTDDATFDVSAAFGDAASGAAASTAVLLPI